MGTNFLLFTGDDYYPGGGWLDFEGRYNTKEEAVEKAHQLKYSWYHIVDLFSLSVVAEGRRGYST